MDLVIVAGSEADADRAAECDREDRQSVIVNVLADEIGAAGDGHEPGHCREF